jgi:GAF domain-containing protein
MRFDEEVAGVVEFLFDRPNAVGDEQVAVALTATGLAQLALQRALLYERAQESHAALDRILRVAPQFHAETADEVTAAICREARTTFGADYGVLWRLRGDMLELVRSDPLRDEWPRGLQVPLAEFPGLATAVRTLGVSFVSDVLAEAQAEGLERVRSLGIRSSLRSSIVIGGRTELVLVVSWQTVVSEPDPSTVAIVRRFADQAGLALEQLERRRAEAEAARRAEDTQRVQEVTAALTNALTSQDVAEVLVDGLREGFDADAVSVSAVVAERYVLKTLAWHGFPDDLAQPEISLDADTPTVGALKRTSSRTYTAGDLESEFSTTDALHDVGHASYLAVPLVAGRERIGVLIMSWHDAAAPDTADRALIETVAGHAALALDRARVFESERTIAETLQRSVLPASLPRVSGVQLAARYLPGTQGVQVGGDWFDAIELPDGRLGLIVGDVMGKGVHAAASM